MLQTIMCAIVSIIIYFYWLYNERDKLYIGQKVYYYLHDETKIYAGRIMAIIDCHREEDITNPASSLRIISTSERKIKKSRILFFEIKPIIGGERLLLSETNIMKSIDK